MELARRVSVETTSEMARDEVRFLGSRGHLAPMPESVARKRIEALSKEATAADRTAGETSWAHGQTLLELYLRQAERSLGFDSFGALLQEHWPLQPARAYERMRLAFFYTCAELKQLGEKKALLGLRLIKALSLYDFDAPPAPGEDRARLARQAVGALEKIPLRLRDDSTVTFPASVRQLDEALWVLWNPTRDDEPDLPAGRKLARTRTWLLEQMEADEDYAALRPVASLQDGDVTVRVTAKGRSGAQAAARLYAELAKRR